MSYIYFIAALICFIGIIWQEVTEIKAKGDGEITAFQIIGYIILSSISPIIIVIFLLAEIISELKDILSDSKMWDNIKLKIVSYLKFVKFPSLVIWKYKK